MTGVAKAMLIFRVINNKVALSVTSKATSYQSIFQISPPWCQAELVATPISWNLIRWPNCKLEGKSTLRHIISSNSISIIWRTKTCPSFLKEWRIKSIFTNIMPSSLEFRRVKIMGEPQSWEKLVKSMSQPLISSTLRKSSMMPSTVVLNPSIASEEQKMPGVTFLFIKIRESKTIQQIIRICSNLLLSNR